MLDSDLIDQLDAVLPQTQCTRCGYAACRPYAQAIALERAPINRCPPGGQTVIRALAALTGQSPVALDPLVGQEGPLRKAFIDESRCIGCALCLTACPVDAISGAFRALHAVIEADCTGCERCLPPCPVDCIEMLTPAQPAEWGETQAARARLHFQKKQLRTVMQSRHEALRDPSDEGQSLQDKQQVLLETARRRAALRRSTRTQT